jgi:hypothetical protein
MFGIQSVLPTLELTELRMTSKPGDVGQLVLWAVGSQERGGGSDGGDDNEDKNSGCQCSMDGSSLSNHD